MRAHRLGTLLSIVSLASATSVLTGCTRHTFERALMATAYRPGPLPVAPAPFVLLAGDMHCHVSPPDAPDDVTRDVAETVVLARDEGIDFVVFTPHLAAGFFADEAGRASAAAGQEVLRRAIQASSPAGVPGPILIRGFEYTDPRFGHATASFADLAAVLAAVPAQVAQAEPARFFEQWVLQGGLLSFNHPAVTSLDSSLARARNDMSWRPWTRPGGSFPPEIVAIHRLAVGVEAYNAAVAQMRDRMFVGDGDYGIRDTMSRLDVEVQSSNRRLAPFGGSDSHSGYLRASVFVLATARSEAGVRDALLHGRTCVKGPEACSLEVRVPGGPWAPVGGAIRAQTEVEVRAVGSDPIVVMRDGAPVAWPPSGAIARVGVPPNVCSLVRARVGDGYSAPIYVNCPFAERTP